MIIIVGGRRGVALLDSGSTNTFIDYMFALKTNYKIINNGMKRVTIAGGGELQTGSHISKCNYKIQGEQFCNTFRLLDLKRYEVILRGDWIYQYSPMTMNLQTRELTIVKNGCQNVTFPDVTKANQSKLIGSRKIQKLMGKGAMGYVLMINSELTDQCQKSKSITTPFELEGILNQ